MASSNHFIKTALIIAAFITTSSCRVTKRTNHPPINQIVNTKPFILIHTNVSETWCSNSAPICANKGGDATASGFLVAYDSTNNRSLIGTAKHVCDNTPTEQQITGPFGGKMHNTKVDHIVRFIDTNSNTLEQKNPKKWMSKTHDLCFFAIDGKIGENPLTTAGKPPERGEDVYNVAAPAGVWANSAVPGFKGQFLGEVTKKDFNFFGVDQIQGLHYYMTNIPAIPGSSGSAVVNEKGEVVSVIFAIPNTKNYSHISFGVPHKIVAEGLGKAKAKFGF